MRIAGIINPKKYDSALRLVGHKEYFTTVSPEVLATSGQSVQRWGDISGNNLDAEQLTESSKALYNPINKSLSHDGSAFYSLSSPMNDVFTADKFTIIWRGKFNNITNEQVIISKGWLNKTAGEFVLLFHFNVVGIGLRFVSFPVTSTDYVNNRHDVYEDSTYNVNQTYTAALTVDKTISTTVDAYAFYKDGVRQTTLIGRDGVRDIPSNASNIMINKFETGTVTFNGEQNELIILPIALSNIEIEAVHKYLQFLYP